MPIYRAEINLPYDTNLPEDVAVNVFHIVSVSGGGEPAAVTEVTDAIINAYTGATAVGGFLSWGAFLSGVVSRTGTPSTLTLYDLADPEPRAPISIQNFTCEAPEDATDLPLEVAACVSWYAEPESGVPPARRRGRTFLGPLNAEALGTVLGGYPGPSGSFISSTVAYAESIIAAATPGVAGIGVYSRVDDVCRPIVGGWFDNELDTQRRRQLRPTARTLF